MQSAPLCPTCGVRDFKSYGRRKYTRNAIDRSQGWTKTALRILFELWTPNRTEAEFDFVGCRGCGLMIYEPRPTAQEITDKYRYVGGMGDATPSKSEDPERTGLRARRVFKLLAPHLSRTARTALDFGGGDGRLLQKYVDQGFDCALVDYADRPIAGVRKVADTEQDIPDQDRYDAIICSHVVEHLPDPLQTLKNLRRSLAGDGAMYVEVPYEVYKQLPAKSEPVTHVNFFTPASLRNLLQAAGYDVVRCGLDLYPHPKGHWSLCVGAIAAQPRGEPQRPANGLAALDRAIAPSRARKLAIRAMRKLYPPIAKARYRA